MTSQTSRVEKKKQFALRHQLQRRDFESENYNVMIGSIGSHSVKSTVSRLTASMGL